MLSYLNFVSQYTMRGSQVFALGILAAGVTGRSLDAPKPDSMPTRWHVDGPSAQQPIHTDSQGGKIQADGWMVQEQDSRVCDAGSRQFTGRVNVTDDKSMFFCTFFMMYKLENRRSSTDTAYRVL